MAIELGAEDRERLERLEESLWQEVTRFDLTRMESVLAEDFPEVGRSGRIYRKVVSSSVTQFI